MAGAVEYRPTQVETAAVGDLGIFVGAVSLAVLVSVAATRRVTAGDRRFAGVALAPAVVLVVWPILTLTGDLRSLGWLALPGLALEVVVLVAAAWSMIQLTLAGVESKTEAEFDARAERALVNWALGFNGVILASGVVALLGLIVLGVTMAVRG